LAGAPGALSLGSLRGGGGECMVLGRGMLVFVGDGFWGAGGRWFCGGWFGRGWFWGGGRMVFGVRGRVVLRGRMVLPGMVWEIFFRVELF
jgi:hypothetical protein